MDSNNNNEKFSKLLDGYVYTLEVTDDVLRIFVEAKVEKYLYLLDIPAKQTEVLSKGLAEDPTGFKDFIAEALTKQNGLDYNLHVTVNAVLNIYYKVGSIKRSLVLTLEKQNRSELEIALSRIRELERKRGFAYIHQQEGDTVSTTNWTIIKGLENIEITTLGGPIKATLDFSAYGNHHGGIRLLMDGTCVFGGDGTYGLDWVAPNDNVWVKRCIVRLLQGIPEGKHSFAVQFRAQAEGQKLQLHYGNANSSDYSGIHVFLEELNV